MNGNAKGFLKLDFVEKGSFWAVEVIFEKKFR